MLKDKIHAIGVLVMQSHGHASCGLLAGSGPRFDMALLHYMEQARLSPQYFCVNMVQMVRVWTMLLTVCMCLHVNVHSVRGGPGFNILQYICVNMVQMVRVNAACNHKCL